MALSWKNPPPVVVIGGTEEFLVQREIQQALLTAQKSGLRTEKASTDADAIDLITGAGTFGDPCLININIKDLDVETAKDLLENPIDRTGLLVRCDGEFNEKKYPVLSLVHGAYLREHKKPSRKGDQEKLAIRFLRHECGRLLDTKQGISEGLAKAVIKVVGTELGVVAFEASKFCALARYKGIEEVDKEVVTSLLKQSDDLDLDSMRTALKNRDKARLALSLYRIRKKSAGDPTMLLLRGRGGPADLAFQWLLVKKLQKSGKSSSEISSRTGISEWILKKDVLPAIKNWEEQKIKKLLFDLSDCERGIFSGAPSPWTALECALINAVSQ